MKEVHLSESNFLLSAIQRGDQKAFDALFRRYYPALCAYGHRFVDLEDAEEIGLTNVVPVIGNGVAIMGTVKEQLSEEAKEKIQNADIIIAKGMGNFESMYQEGMNPYYLLLCKCELYKEIFGVEMFQPIFCKEERL